MSVFSSRSVASWSLLTSAQLSDVRKDLVATNEEWINNISRNREQCCLLMTAQTEKQIGILSAWCVEISRSWFAREWEKLSGGVTVEMIEGSAHRLKIGRAEVHSHLTETNRQWAFSCVTRVSWSIWQSVFTWKYDALTSYLRSLSAFAVF